MTVVHESREIAPAARAVGKPTLDDLGVDPDAQAWKPPGAADGTITVAFPRVPGWRPGDWVLMRVSGDADGRTLVFDRNEWECFLDGARKGEFNDAAAALPSAPA